MYHFIMCLAQKKKKALQQIHLIFLFCFNFFLFCYFPNTFFFSSVQPGDPVTHKCIHSFFLTLSCSTTID